MSQTIAFMTLFSIFAVYSLGVNGITDDGVSYNSCLTWDDTDTTISLTCRIPRSSTFVKFYHEDSKTTVTCNLTRNAAICDPSNTNVRYFHPNDQTVVVLQKLKHERNLNGVWYCQSGENGRKLRTDIDLNKGITSDAWVKIKTAVVQSDQGKQKVLIECSSCRKPFRNYTEIWVNGQTSTSVWLNPNGHCIHGRDAPCDPHQCSCSATGNRFEIAYDNVKTGTEFTCSMYFKDDYRQGRYHVTANTTLNGRVLSSCPDSTKTLPATDDISTFISPGYRTGSYEQDLSCSWLIDSGNPSATIIIFITHYDVTSPDAIVIHNGFSTSNAALTTPPGLSGNGTNKYFMTTGQYALVVFTTDSQEQGFSMQYCRAKDLSGTGCNEEQTLIARHTDQFLTSPFFPRAYPGYLDCRWLIKTPTGRVKIELLVIDIQSSPNCGSDYLKIFDVRNAGEQYPIDTACERFSGTTTNYTSNGTSVLVIFVSDARIGYRGFKLKYSSVTAPITIKATTTLLTRIIEISLDKSYIPLWIGIGVGFISFVCCMVCVCRKYRSSHSSKIDNTLHGPTNQQTFRNVQISEDSMDIGSDYASIDENQILSQADLQLELSVKIRPVDNASYCSIISSSPLPSSDSANLNGYLDVIADPYESPVSSRYSNCTEEHKYCTTVNKDVVHVYQNDAFVQ